MDIHVKYDPSIDKVKQTKQNVYDFYILSSCIHCLTVSIIVLPQNYTSKKYDIMLYTVRVEFARYQLSR